MVAESGVHAAAPTYSVSVDMGHKPTGENADDQVDGRSFGAADPLYLYSWIRPGSSSRDNLV